MSWSVTGSENFPKGDNPMGNRFYGYRKVDLSLPDGRKATYHGVDVGACVHTVGIDEDETTYFVRQPRPNIWSGSDPIPYTLELPGGFADPELTLIQSARREFAQEVGLRPTRMELLGSVWPSTGTSNEIDTLFLGTEMIPDPDAVFQREATEQDIRIVTMPFGEAYERFTSGQDIVSAQTLSALALAKYWLK